MRVVCSFWGSADTRRPNLPAVFGHGLLRSVQSLMWSSTLCKVHKWDFNSCPEFRMQSVFSTTFHSSACTRRCSSPPCVHIRYKISRILESGDIPYVWRLAAWPWVPSVSRSVWRCVCECSVRRWPTLVSWTLSCLCLNNVLQETLLSATSRTQASAVISGQPLLSPLCAMARGILRH